MGYSRVWEQRDDELDGRVNGRRAVSSAQISGDIVILGKFSEMLWELVGGRNPGEHSQPGYQR